MIRVMKRTLSGTAAVAAILLITLSAACGSPPETGIPSAAGAAVTRDLPDTSPPPQRSATAEAAATATAVFEAVNQKFSLAGQPTFPPGTDLAHPFADVTYPPTEMATPGPSPTPQTPACGSTISGWDALHAQYGGFEQQRGNACRLYDGQLVIATSGRPQGGPGAIAVYDCEQTDASCLAGRAPSAPGAAWSVYPAPFNEGIAIWKFVPPAKLLLIPESCFDLATHTYDLDPGCFP